MLKFKRREGHCRVRGLHREGKYKLGRWVVVQRRKKNVMSPKRRARLNKIGFVWHVYRPSAAGNLRGSIATLRIRRIARTIENLRMGQRPQSSSASRVTAGAFRFLTLIQCGDRPLTKPERITMRGRLAREWPPIPPRRGMQSIGGGRTSSQHCQSQEPS